MATRFGIIQIANSEPFSCHLNGFGISPFLQEKLVFLGQSEVYKEAAELAHSLLGIPVCSSQVYRLTNYYGAAIEADLVQVPAAPEPESVPTLAPKVVYVQIDGAHLPTDEGYKEVKLARIFPDTALQISVVEDRGGTITESEFVAHLGTSTDFDSKLAPQLDRYKALEENVVGISDGATWIRHIMERSCPKATLILDLYHCLSHISDAGVAAFGSGKQAMEWLDNQRNLLLGSCLDSVLANIKGLSIDCSLRDSVCSYLESNRDRMDYKSYRERGLLIGSGAIESAHRTVMQRRLKRSGQRWSIRGAQQVLNLRVCSMSGRWRLVRERIEPIKCTMDT
jgi:hypothetical protein